MNTDEALQQMLEERRALRRRLSELESRIQDLTPVPPIRATATIAASLRRGLTWSEALVRAKIPVSTASIGVSR